MIGGAKGIGIGIDFGIPNQYCRATSKPYIEKDVLDSLRVVASAYGKSNDDADRSIVKNLVDASNPFIISNAAFKLNSGFGKYSADFESFDWAVNISQKQHNKATISLNGRLCNHAAIEVDEMKVNIIGNVTELIYWYIANPDDTTRSEIRLTSGINTLPKSYAKDDGQTYNIGFAYISGDSEITIEQIPSFEGAFVTDGIDDLIKSTKSATEMLDGSNEVTVVSMIHQIKTNDDTTRNNWFFTPVSYLENRVVKDKIGKTGIYGYTSTNVTNAQISDITPILGDKNDYTLYSKIEDGDRDYFTVEGFQNQGIWYVSSIAWYWTIIANKVLTTDQINQVIAYFNLDRTLKPDILCNTIKQGITNENHAEFGDKLIDFSGNGRDIQLNNIAWNKESGIDDDGALRLDGVNDFGKVTGMPIYKDYTVVADREIIDGLVENADGGVALKGSRYLTGAFCFDYKDAAFSFGTPKMIPLDTKRFISYQSKYVSNGISINIGTATDNDELWIGRLGNDERYSKIAIRFLMSFPYSMSEFLIERQLKKHKLGTLYPDMVEFRPVIKKDDRIKSIKYYIDGKTANIGQYYPIGTGLGIEVETVQPYMVKSLKVNGVNTIPNVDYKGFNTRLDSKSPQKITMDIQVDTNLIQWNPIITSTVELTTAPTFAIRGTSTLLKPGDWIPKNSEIWVIVTMNNLIDELRKFSFNGTFINIPSSSYNPDTGKYGFPFVIDNESTQNINLTIDEYIRFEDIVQPYPVLLRFNDENGNEVSWGGKFRVGSTITRIGSAADSNLLPNIYDIFGLLLNDNQVTSSKVIVEKTMVFKAKSAYIFDNNEPNCILSPRLLRIPNSSYKILGYIPDISGHGNHGVIHNSAYGEGSGVNKDGSYQFDGVDDHITIPTVTGGGKQVLMKVNNNTINSMLYDQRSSGASPNSLYDDFAIYCTNSADNNQIAYQSRLVGNTYIDGILNTNITCEDLLGVLHNITITCDIVAPNNGVVPNIGRGGVLKDLYSNMALYDFMLFDNISTDDKIKELNEYVGIEAKVELPSYYWDTYGKTNLDADKATIQQRGVAEGDYDITNYNHAYDKMSGYGGYNLGRFDKSWASSPNTSIKVVQRNPYDITLKKLGGNSDWEFNNTELKVISNPVSVKFKSNKNIRVTCDYHYYPVGGNSEGVPLGITSKDLIANKDAIITISPISQENIDKYNIDVNRGYYLIYFQLSSTLAVNEEVTIEMLPLYPNALLYDGVTDYSENNNIPALTDYTYIFKRELLNNTTDSCSLYKGDTDVVNGQGFVADYISQSGDIRQYSFGGYVNVPSLNTDKIIYGTKTSANGIPVSIGSGIDTVGMALAKWKNVYRKMVFYKLILYPKTIELLQINFLKNLMERDEIIDLNNPIFIQE